VVLIVRDEAADLRACLETVAWADEIVVVDAGSTDGTVAIAREFTDNVTVEAEWRGFGVQRQRAQARATGDWILMVDADERVSPELRRSIEQAVAADEQDVVYALSRLTYCFGRFVRHGGWYPDWTVRLYPRMRAGYDNALVHEGVRAGPDMRTLRLRGDLLHYTYRDMQHYLSKSAAYAAAWAEERRLRGRKAGLAQGIGHAAASFVKMYVLRAGFLDGRTGLLLALLSSHSTFVKYADLWTRGLPPQPPAVS
jgi:(heptosyl)LPS beta-1,4-glucosyltransferase